LGYGNGKRTEIKNITEGGLPVSEVEGVSLLHSENGASVYKIESGNYNFRIKKGMISLPPHSLMIILIDLK
jgi:hypothetical protein